MSWISQRDKETYEIEIEIEYNNQHSNGINKEILFDSIRFVSGQNKWEINQLFWHFENLRIWGEKKEKTYVVLNLSFFLFYSLSLKQYKLLMSLLLRGWNFILKATVNLFPIYNKLNHSFIHSYSLFFFISSYINYKINR